MFRVTYSMHSFRPTIYTTIKQSGVCQECQQPSERYHCGEKIAKLIIFELMLAIS